MTAVERGRSAAASPLAGSPVLARSLAFVPEVGSNRRGAVAGAGWLYALPHLSFRRIVCIGAPSTASLVGLARATPDLAVVEPSGRRRGWLERAASEAGLGRVDVVANVASLRPGVAPDLLVVLASRPDVAEVASALAFLAPDGLAWLPDAATGGADDGVAFDVRPGRGEARSVTRADDDGMRASARRLGLEGRWLPDDPRLARVIRRLPAGIRDRIGGSPARGAVLSGGAGRPLDAVPAYIEDVAAAGGRELDGWGWAVAARGDYDSQKVLVLLRPPDGTEPTGVVKVTRSEVHAERLDNEAVALTRLADLAVAAGRAPEPWFHGHHAGRTLLGESLVEGGPFAEVARWSASCPNLSDAAAWLTDLGAATATWVSGEAVAAALLTLLERYEGIYRPDVEERSALRERFGAVARLTRPIPTVFQHGDPGTWNLLVGADGRTVFLDWESAEPDGLPLWDLLYFLRSYAIGAGRREGIRDRLEAAGHHLLDGSPLGDRMVELVTAYRDRVGVPAEATQALLLGCWVHRSLKEAGRLTADRLADGQSVRWIRRLLERPDAPGLAALTGSAR